MHVQPSHKSRVTDCLLCAGLLSFLLGVGRDEGRAASWPWHTNERAACVPPPDVLHIQCNGTLERSNVLPALHAMPACPSPIICKPGRTGVRFGDGYAM